MNYLAHAYLSGNDEEILTGNFIADTVKGKYDHFPEGIQKGIRMHHAIDDFCDHNAHFRCSVTRIEQRHQLYSPVIVDIYYDHFLAANWELFHSLGLKHYAATVYRIVLSRYQILPIRMKRMLPYMISTNWLAAYADADNLKRFFTGLSKRTSGKNNMPDAREDLRAHYNELWNDFMCFMKDITIFTEQYKRENFKTEI